MSYTLQDIYKEYVHAVEFVDKKLFRDVCEEFNIEIIKDILNGNTFDMGNNLSTLSIVRKERDPRNPRVDWGESNKYKKELLEEGKELYNAETEQGIKWHIYYTDGYYCKFYWRKGKCRIPNKSVYRFDATRGIKGNKEKLINLLKTDDLAYLKFKKE
tara:strand:+ start:9177 stop:9650 length:474 start_codon:yes stop_codon:yes gene_type:complete